MADFVIYGWPITALVLAAVSLCYFTWEARRLDRADVAGARDAAKAAHRRDDPSVRPR